MGRAGSSSAVRGQLETALDHHRAGRLGDAKKIYQKLLRLHPDQPDANHLLGVLALDDGDPETAVRLISRALRGGPANPSAHNNLGNALRVLRRRDEAAQNYRRAIALAPRFAAAHCNLGVLHADLGEFDLAIKAFGRALSLDAVLYEAWLGISRAHAACGRWEAEVESLRKALAIRPNDPAALHGFVIAAARTGSAAESLETIARIVDAQPNSVEALSHCARASYLLGLYVEAARLYARAAALDDATAATWSELGRTRRVLGDFEEAARCFRNALALDPRYLDAKRNLALIGAPDVSVASFRALPLDPEASEWDRVLLGFTRGELLDKAGAYDDAFAAYAKANAGQKQINAARGLTFDHQALRGAVTAVVSRRPMPAAGFASPSEAPVFIVGMPRSGTSLVEQILASHSAVFGAGERKSLRHLKSAREADELSPADLEQYLRQWIGDRRGVERALDKMPDNVFLLDTVASLFPSARVIYCDRDPYDTILSCYFQLFQDANVFSTDLVDCAHQYAEVARLRSHWEAVFGDRFTAVGYEMLVNDLAGESRRLIEFLGLDWEEGCLNFHRNERPVATASGWQVRQPLYQTSVGRWRHYESHLADARAIIVAGSEREGLF